MRPGSCEVTSCLLVKQLPVKTHFGLVLQHVKIKVKAKQQYIGLPDPLSGIQ